MKAWKSKHGAEMLNKHKHRVYEYAVPWRRKQEKTKGASMIYLLQILFLPLIALNLLGVISLSWWIILFPYYVVVAIPVIIVSVVIIFAVGFWIFYGLWFAGCVLYELIRDVIKYIIGR